MLPFLFPGTWAETPTYFALYLLGFLGGIILGTRIAIRYGLNPVRAVDIGIGSFVFGFAGARLFHILLEAPQYYIQHPIRVFYFWQGGFVLYGGLICGILGCCALIRYWKDSPGTWANVAAAPILLGIGIGRMGCLAAGCCHGATTDWWWGMVFTNPRSGAPLHIALHPTQALEALFAFTMAFVIYKVYPKPPQRAGEPLVMAMLSYSEFRFVIEYLRGDFDRGVYFENVLSTSQIIAVAAVIGCLIWLFWPHKKSVD